MPGSWAPLPRHVLQQCDYSFRATFHTEKGAWHFTGHTRHFGGRERLASERLTEFNNSSANDPRLWTFLDAFNLNAYLVFGSEESLMETMALREFDLK
jgi:hypothetical protein